MHAPIRVLTVTPSLSRQAGGLFFSVRRLTQHLAGINIIPSVFGIWDHDLQVDYQAWLPIQPLAFRSWLSSSSCYAPALSKALKDSVNENTIIHQHGIWTFLSYSCLAVSRKHHIPRIISPRGMLDTWGLRRARLKKRLALSLYEKANLKTAQCIHALCEAELIQLRNYGLRNPIAIIPNGVDVPEKKGSNRAPETMPHHWSNRKIMLFVSRIHSKKGLDILIKAWADALRVREDWALAIVGQNDNQYAIELVALIDSYFLQKSIKLIGPAYGSEKDEWFRKACAFVLPSYSEGLPMAVLEAMAYALPVLITPQCNIPEIISSGCGIMVNPTVSDIAEGLRSIAKMSDTSLHAMGNSGKAIAIRVYNWHSIAAKMGEVYHWLLGHSARPSFVVAD